MNKYSDRPNEAMTSKNDGNTHITYLFQDKSRNKSANANNERKQAAFIIQRKSTHKKREKGSNSLIWFAT